MVGGKGEVGCRVIEVVCHMLCIVLRGGVENCISGVRSGIDIHSVWVKVISKGGRW